MDYIHIKVEAQTSFQHRPIMAKNAYPVVAPVSNALVQNTLNSSGSG